jgi:hypothetical protein
MKSALTMDYRKPKVWFLDYEFFVLFILALIAVTISFFIQEKILNKDVGVIIHETNLLLAGGNYVTSFFETNPPMILYLTAPISFISELFSLNPLNVSYCYISILALLSALTCYFLITKLVQDKFTPLFTFAGILFAFFILPLNEFGEREHFAILFTTPYVFAAALAFNNKPLNKQLSFWIGLFGGVGFALKPYFLLPLCLIELSFILRYSTIFAWVRIESLTVLGLMLIYLAAIFYFHPAYLSVVLPLLERYYFKSIAIAWHAVFINKAYNFCIATFIATLCLLRNNRNANILLILTLSLAGYIGAFLITQTDWYYHLIPALSISIITLTFCLGTQINTWISERRISFTPELCAAMTVYFLYFMFVLSGVPRISENLLISVKLFCLLSISTLATLMIYLDKKSWIIALSLLAITLGILQIKTIPFELSLLKLDRYYFVIVDFIIAWTALNVFVLLFLLTTQYRMSWLPTVQKSLSFTLFTAMAYFFPLHNIHNRFNLNHNLINSDNQIVKYLAQFPNRGGLYCLSSNDPGVCVRMSYYTKHALVSRQPSIWWLRGFAQTPESPQALRDKQFLTSIIASDIQKNHPQWIFINENVFSKMGRFNFLDFLATNETFRKEWANYELRRTFPNNSPAKHAIDNYVYERKLGT